MGNKTIERLGSVEVNKQGCLMKVVERYGSEELIVEFQDEHHYRTRVSWSNFKKGKVKNPFAPSVYGVGYLGVDEFGNKPITRLEGKNTLEYRTWQHMLSRCYYEKYQAGKPSYIGCEVCEDWKCFVNFLKDFKKLKEENNWSDSTVLALDKDLIQKGNKIYSIENCIFIPTQLNSILTTNKASRGECCVGVSFCKKNKKFEAYYNINNTKEHLGYFNTEEEAFIKYKNARENYIKELRDFYVSQGFITLDSRLYKAMTDYRVDKND